MRPNIYSSRENGDNSFYCENSPDLFTLKGDEFSSNSIFVLFYVDDFLRM